MKAKLFSLLGLIFLSLTIVFESCLPGDISSKHSFAIFNFFSNNKKLEIVSPQAITDIKYDGVVYVNRFMKFTPSFFPLDTTDTRVSWSTNNDDIEVSHDGSIRALKEGTFFIKATSLADKAISKEIEIAAISISIEEISLSLTTEKSILIGASLQINTNFFPNDATYKTCQFFSRNANIAEVDEYGIIRGVSNGETEIYAKSSNIESNHLQIAVLNRNALPVTQFTASKQMRIYASSINDVSISFNTSASDKSFHFEDFDPNFLNVEGEKIIGKKITPATTIKVVSNSNPSFFETITVEIIPVLAKAITISIYNSIEVGHSEQLSYALIPEIAGLSVTSQAVKWESSDKTIALIDEYGKICGLKTGRVTVKVLWKENSAIFDEKTTTIAAISRIKYNQIIGIIRKGLGHFSLFLVTGIFAIIYFSKQFCKHKKYIVSLLACIYGLYIAVFSEILQIFSPSRAPSILDVGINMLGFLTGLLLVYIFKRIIFIRKKGPSIHSTNLS